MEAFNEADMNAADEKELAFFFPLFMSVLAGLATGIGASVVFVLDRSPSPPQLSFSLALAAGVMLAVSIFDMWLPLCMREGFLWPSAAAGLGALLFQGISYLLPSQEDAFLPLQYRDAKDHSGNKSRHFRLAMIMMVTLTAHNFPEGLAVSVSTLKSESLGSVVTVAIALHNIPEGLAIATPYFAATGNRLQSVLMALLSGLSEPLGALISLTVLRPLFLRHDWLVHYVLCFVGGIMTAVSFIELIPEARRYKRPGSFLSGLISGGLVMGLTKMYV